MKSHARAESRDILGLLGICIIAALPFWPLVSAIFGGLSLFTLFFFRDPSREPPEDETLVVAPADGLVVEVSETLETDYLQTRVHRIGIFLSIFDVHVNRAPIAGKILESKAGLGKFLDARNPESARLNARRTWVFAGENATVVVRQITGAVARRICAWKKAGDYAMRGERFGMIRFGSRTEVDLPLASEILVKPGDRVLGGKTPVARLDRRVT